MAFIVSKFFFLIIIVLFTVLGSNFVRAHNVKHIHSLKLSPSNSLNKDNNPLFRKKLLTLFNFMTDPYNDEPISDNTTADKIINDFIENQRITPDDNEDSNSENKSTLDYFKPPYLGISIPTIGALATLLL